MKKISSNSLIFLLVGILFGGKGFCYINYGNFFIADFIFAISLIMLIPSLLLSHNKNKFRLNIFNPFIILTLNFVYQFFIILLHYESFSIDLIRDFIFWIYAIFAFITYYLHIHLNNKHSLIEILKKYAHLYLFALPFLFFLIKFLIYEWHFIKNSPVPILYIKSGDVGVFLSILIAMYSFNFLKLKGINIMLLIGNIFIWSITNRGGMLCILFTITYIALVNYKSLKLYLSVVTFSILIIAFFYANIEIDIPLSRGKSISLNQFTDNLTSIFVESDHRLESTKQWRLNIWYNVIDYTFFGDYFFGKGYGASLADLENYQVSGTSNLHNLRSPHNIFITILARSGVPGLFMFVFFLISLLFKAFFSKNDSNLMRVHIIAILAMIINASFDVYFENPMGAIPFWSVVGSTVFLINKEKYKKTQLIN